MSLRDDIVRVAREQIGKPYDERYSFPWEGPASDYDSFNCSGLVRAVYDQCGVTIPGFQRASLGDSQSQWVMDAGDWHWGTDGLQPGDLVFWQDGDDWTDTYHVGIYTEGEMCVSANGPRMGVAEHSVWIDSNFIGGTSAYGGALFTDGGSWGYSKYSA
jgi:cell wall-associated NlpC family hydrolase